MTRRRVKRQRRSTAEWIVRTTLAVMVAGIGYAGTSSTFAQVIRMGDPERAHVMAPFDGRLTALLAQRAWGTGADAAGRRRADRLAVTALRQDPTAVVAVATLALDTQLRGDSRRARRQFGYAERLSRRDFQTQLWAIEDSVSRGDVRSALRHYDIALRTTRRAPDLLFPILSVAIAEPKVRQALVTTLRRLPGWGPHFIGFAAGQGGDPQATTKLFADLRRIRYPVSTTSESMLIDRLVEQGMTEAAWSYYGSIRPSEDRRRSRDPHFERDPDAASVFDWRPVNDVGISSSVQRASRGGVVDIVVSPSVGGKVIQQGQALPPGRYRLRGHAAGVDQPPADRPYWTLMCRDGRELGRITLSASGEASGSFDVPDDCGMQTLALVVRPSVTVAGVNIRLDYLRLEAW